MLKVSVDIKGDRQTVEKLKKLGASIKDWSPELKEVGEYLKGFYQNPVFETEGGVFGARWKPLSPAYDLRKRSDFPGRGTLERTGRMRRSFEYEVRPTEMVLENRAGYAKFHQFGTRNMPARVLIKVDSSRKDGIVRIFKEGLIKKIAKDIK